MKKYEVSKISENTDNSIIIEFFIPKESPYFDGHFPEVSILPAVAQVDIVLDLLKQYFNKGISIIEIKKAKFTNLITPLIPLVLQLDKNGKLVVFKISSPDNEKSYSNGTLFISESL